MKLFLKLNVLSMVFASVFFVNAELMLNVYRIGRITGWDLGAVVNTAGIALLAGFILCTILFYIILRNWTGGQNAGYWSTVLWFPYFVLFEYIFTLLFPITYGGDKPAPVSGLIMLVEAILYPVYLAALNFISISLRNRMKYK